MPRTLENHKSHREKRANKMRGEGGILLVELSHFLPNSINKRIRLLKPLFADNCV